MPDVPLREATATAEVCTGLPFCKGWGTTGPCFGLPCCARALLGTASGALLLMSAVASDAPGRSCTGWQLEVLPSSTTAASLPCTCHNQVVVQWY